ncbi:MAG: BamA/TamA family outer membrane protein [Leptolyngbyaceae bacterium]|nr:BamA/TamA family outer membrane protein [Leptolyngbyaceae bacterium]
MRFSPVLLASIAFSASLGGVSSAQALEWGQSGSIASGQPDVVWAMTAQPNLKSEEAIAKPSGNEVKPPGREGNNGDAVAVETAIASIKPATLANDPDVPLAVGNGSMAVPALSGSDGQAEAIVTPDAPMVTLNPATDAPPEKQSEAEEALDDPNAESDPVESEAMPDSPTPGTPDTASDEPAMETDPATSEEDVSPPVTPSPLTPSPLTPSLNEERVLIIDVNVTGVDDRPELRDAAYRAIQIEPGQTATESQLQNDINAIFATGLFSGVQAGLENTPLGVRLNVNVVPNPILTNVTIEGSALAAAGETLTFGNEELTIEQVVEAIFSPQYGRTLNRVPPEFAEDTLNLGTFQIGINELYQIYTENGYVLAQVVDAAISDDGEVTLVVAEGIIEDIEVQFLDEDGFAEDEDGNAIEGKTREFIITREFESQSGDVFNQLNIQQDLQNVFGLGIFDDVRVSLNPGDDPRKVDVIVNVIEGSTGSVAAGAGFSSASGFFGSASYQQQNLGGNNQSLGAEVQVGERELLFDIRFSDPWIATDPYRTSYTVNTFLRRSISLIFDGGDTEVDLCDQRNDLDCNQSDLTDGDRPRVQRLGGGISFSRPLDEWLGWEGWRASTGFQYQRVSLRDGDGDISYIDALGNQLSFTDDGKDDLFLLQLAAVRDRRNNPLQPTQGSLLRFGTEQSIPLGSGSILLNRLRASYSRYVPVDLTSFEEGAETLAFNVQAGTVLGDLPPYEAFSLGGTDSVRGYDAGELGSGRSFLQATAEYRFPVFSIVGGALFVDFGTDLGTAAEVPGAPADVRGKPGTGFGYGLGVRVQSPLGQIRVDYGINDDGDGRIHFGIGERF